ncbi:hypothetical protein CDL12_02846 [Handroanthus impetiginosus]|uniref:RPW8 domain-containing protein n=1 Tax=Handroanthus impetiginosus TaxID=429701 RepID=A0A2G9I3U7_9LAMI|nr:hypothetical protein CDL12_02846 [Handroanthus impetiginosus]
MGGLVQGAALGAAFELLCTSVLEASQNVVRFSSDLARLESTLCSIELAIDDVENFNKILDAPKHETETLTERLLEGEKLIRKCSKVKWNVFKRLYYSKKLRKLEALLLNYFQINVAAFHFRESKRMSVALNNVNEKLTELATIVNNRGENGVGSSNVFPKLEDGESADEISPP